MHRSGTSLLASWLASCGLHLGNELAGKALGNIKGHYEDMDFIHLHDKLLKEANITDGGFSHLSNIKLISSSLIDAKISDLLHFKATFKGDWGWKDPRTCLFLPHYEKLLPNVKVIAIFRHPLEVVDSLLRREEAKLARRIKKKKLLKEKYYQFQFLIMSRYLRYFKARQYLNAWTYYNKKLIKFLEKKDRNEYIIINLSNLEKHQTEISDTLSNWGFALKKIPLGSVIEKALLQNSSADLNSHQVDASEAIFLQLQDMAHNSFKHCKINPQYDE